MSHHLSEAQWVSRYLAKLETLLPALPIAEATQWAIQTYAATTDLQPEEAAEIFAQNH